MIHSLTNLKKAKVIPILKSGGKSDLNNYRPISMLPAFSKLVEKTISSRLINYVEKKNNISKDQQRSRANHSAESAILEFVNNVYSVFKQKLYVAGIFIDLSKGFDPLDHKILLHKSQM